MTGHGTPGSSTADVVWASARTIDGGRVVIDVRDDDAGTQYMILSRRAVHLLRQTLESIDQEADRG